MTAMNLTAGFAVKTILMVIALSGYLVLETNSQKIRFQHLLKLSHSLNAITGHLLPTGHLQLLRQCRRQLTLLVSAALGTFITRIIKESPLTPLPLPPLEDQPRWNFMTSPLHAAAPYMKWMGGRFRGKPQHFYKGSDHLQPPWREPNNAIDITGWRRRRRYRRDLTRLPKSSPNFIASAIAKTLESMKSLIDEDVQARQLLLRLCH